MKLAKILVYLTGLLSVTGCLTAPLMREPYFNAVEVGSNVSDIETFYGEPYEVRELPSGMQEYSYIQRIELGSSAVEQLEFVFLVNQGKVVSKMCKHNGTSSFQFVP